MEEERGGYKPKPTTVHAVCDDELKHYIVLGQVQMPRVSYFNHIKDD